MAPAFAQDVCSQPVVMQRAQVRARLHLRSILKLGLKAAIAGDVVEVLLKVDHTARAAGDLDHHLRRAACDPRQACFGRGREGGRRGLGSKRTENLCKPSPTSIYRVVAQLLSSATTTAFQAGRALFCRKCMSHKAEIPRQVARHGLTSVFRSLAPQTPGMRSSATRRHPGPHPAQRAPDRAQGRKPAQAAGRRMNAGSTAMRYVTQSEIMIA